MRKTAVAVVSAILLAFAVGSTANAMDFDGRWYAGLTAGASGFDTSTETCLGLDACVLKGDGIGFTGGAFTGVNFIDNGRFVTGVEAGVLVNPFKTSGTLDLFGVHVTENANVPVMGTLTLRAGLRPVPELLIYGKGGFALASVTIDGRASNGNTYGGNQTRMGWTVGGGIEKDVIAFGRALRLGVEANYFDLGSKESRIDFGSKYAPKVAIPTELNGWTAMVRVTVPFGSAAPATPPLAYAPVLVDTGQLW